MKSIRIKYLALWALVFLFGGLSSCQQAKNQKENKQSKNKTPQNIILLIGDGMGVSQMSSAFYSGKNEPNFSHFPVVGLINTSSCSDKITDSAAGATAFSTGKKAKNQTVGLDCKGKEAENLVEYFSENGIKTGLVATSSITHATPAAFYAHVDSRYKEKKVASQLAGSEVDYFAGGGQKFFAEKDRQNLRENGFTIYQDSLTANANIRETSKAGFLLAENGMPKISEGRGNFLPQATSLGLSFLSKTDSGFFMMVEGSQIDWGGHANDANYLTRETLDFDRAVGRALDFARENGNTLVIVTADHETGGFTLAAAEDSAQGSNYNKIAPRFSTGGHSAALVPVLAYGPGSERFSGIYENTAIHRKILEVAR